jgi:hypothetical protein
LHSSTGAEQKTDPDLIFKSTDPLCDRRRRQLKPTRGLGERALLDHSDEAFEKACIHSKQKLSSETTIINILFGFGRRIMAVHPRHERRRHDQGAG